MRSFYAIAKITAGQVRFTPTEAARFRRFKQTFEGKAVLITVSDISRRRSDQFHRLYRKRNQQIADFTGQPAESIHELLFMKAGFGVYDDEIAEAVVNAFPETIEAKTIKFRRFFRQSANDVTNEDMKELFRLQDELVAELNDGIHPDNWLRLAGGDDIKLVDKSDAQN